MWGTFGVGWHWRSPSPVFISRCCKLANNQFLIRSSTTESLTIVDGCLSDGQKRAFGTLLISLGCALVANSLCQGQEKHIMRELEEVQVENSR